MTSAVGIFPEGVSPFGVDDMMGNVVEWTLNEFNSGESDDLTNSKPRTARGGSWFRNQDSAHILYRGGGNPNDRYGSVGFRVVKVND
jgi:formylglycine-generating enzyme required for sulfatase activity